MSDAALPGGLSDAAVIRGLLSPHPAKRLARLMGQKLGTARHWLYRQVPAERRPALALLLIAEFERQEAERRRIRAALQAMLGPAPDLDPERGDA